MIYIMYIILIFLSIVLAIIIKKRFGHNVFGHVGFYISLIFNLYGLMYIYFRYFQINKFSVDYKKREN